MRARLPWILFALSLALNIAFIGGAVWMRMHGFHPHGDIAERIDYVAREVSLDPAQREALERFVSTARMGFRQLREKNEPVTEEWWRELAKPETDQATLDRILAQSAANRREFQLQTGQSLHEFLTKLSPEQRERFIKMMRERNKAVPGPLRFLP